MSLPIPPTSWIASSVAAGDGVALLDTAGRILWCNPTLAHYLSRPESSLLDSDFAEILPDQARPMHENAFAAGHYACMRVSFSSVDAVVEIYPLPITPGAESARFAVVVRSAESSTTSQPTPEEQASRRLDQLENDVRLYQRLEMPTRVDPESLARVAEGSLRSRDEPAFDTTVDQFGRLLADRLDQRGYVVDHKTGERLIALSRALSQLWAGPRDLIEIYSLALKIESQGVPPSRASALAEEARLMLLELMGRLLASYRTTLLETHSRVSPGSTPPSAPPHSPR